MKLNLFSYDDPYKTFVVKCLRQISYFRDNLTRDDYHSLVYRLNRVMYEKDQIILRERCECDSIMVL